MSAYDPASGQMHRLYERGWWGDWSPNASSVTYTRSGPQGAEVWIRHILSGEGHRLSLGGAKDWSPDGDWIAARWLPAGSPAGPPPYLFLVRTDGSGEIQIIGRGGMSHGAISPDGEWVLFTTGGALLGGTLRARRVDGSREVVIYSSSDLGAESWSPTAPTVLFGAEDPCCHQLHIISIGQPTGPWPRPVGRRFTWSPVGTAIAYIPDTQGSGPDILHIASSEPPDIIKVGETAGSFSWSPDGRLIALSVGDFGQATGIYIADPLTGERRSVADGQGVAWSPP